MMGKASSFHRHRSISTQPAAYVGNFDELQLATCSSLEVSGYAPCRALYAHAAYYMQRAPQRRQQNLTGVSIF